MAVISFEIVKYNRDFSFAWFYSEFKVAILVCGTSVFTLAMAVVSYFWIVFIITQFLFTYPAMYGFLIIRIALFCHDYWLWMSKGIADIAHLTI